MRPLSFCYWGRLQRLSRGRRNKKKKLRPHSSSNKLSLKSNSNNRSNINSSKLRANNNRSNTSSNKPRGNNNRSKISISKPTDTINRSSISSNKPRGSRISNTNSSRPHIHILPSAHSKQWPDNGNSRPSISAPGVAVEFQTSVFTPILDMTTISESAIR